MTEERNGRQDKRDIGQVLGFGVNLATLAAILLGGFWFVTTGAFRSGEEYRENANNIKAQTGVVETVVKTQGVLSQQLSTLQDTVRQQAILQSGDHGQIEQMREQIEQHTSELKSQDETLHIQGQSLEDFWKYIKDLHDEEVMGYHVPAGTPNRHHAPPEMRPY